MANIPKDLSDADMFKHYKETISFENDPQPDDKLSPAAKPSKNERQGYEASFLTPQLQQAVGKALLALKLKLYKEGIVDYDIKVKQEGHQVLLTAVPKKRLNK
jgi:hypothetical protein